MKNRLNAFLLLILLGLTIVSCKKNELTDELSGKAPVIAPHELAFSVKDSLINPNLIYEELFEGTNPFATASSLETGNWDYAIQFVDDPMFEGFKSARFEIRDTQALIQNGKRSEAVIVKGANGDITNDTWYSFSVLFPTDGYEFDSEREVINQWYQNGSPATSIRTQNDRILLESGNLMTNRVRIDLCPIIKDTWQEFVLHFIHSFGPDGLIEIWHNGTKILTKTGGNMYDDVLPKWKLGLYKAAFKVGTSLVNRRVIYFDNIRVGNPNATFFDMTSMER